MKNLTVLLGAVVLVLGVIPRDVHSSTVQFTPESWYQKVIRAPDIWMPSQLYAVRDGNKLSGVYWVFDISTFGSYSSLDSVSIAFEYSQDSNLGLRATMVFFEGETNWPSDNTLSFFEQPTTIGMDNGPQGMLTMTEINITRGFRMALDSGINIFTIGLQPDFPHGDAYGAYFSPSATIIEANYTVPIPSAIWLLSSGLIGLLGVRRMFRKEASR